jgi:hypothetical protein
VHELYGSMRNGQSLPPGMWGFSATTIDDSGGYGALRFGVKTRR